MFVNGIQSKTDCMFVSKRKSPRTELRIGETDTKQVGRFKCLGRVLTEDGKSEIALG